MSTCYNPVEAFDFRETFKVFPSLELYRKLHAEGVDISYLKRIEDKGCVMFYLPVEWSSFTEDFLQQIFEQFHIKRIYLPCGKCLACQLRRSREWALRCMHESKLHQHNSFITLTYRDEIKKSGDSLDPKDFVDFMKRFRRRIEPLKIRFFHCGEYGTEGGKPHHHACIFGYDFPDKYLWRVDLATKCCVYRSPLLESLWPFGYSTIGNVTFESAAYVARYVTKKQYGDAAERHYNGRHPEYITMSRRPGIASDWITSNYEDVYPKDFITLKRGTVSMKPPRFYDKVFEQINPEEMEKIKQCRSDKCTDVFLSPADYENLRKIENSKRKQLKDRLPRNLEKNG